MKPSLRAAVVTRRTYNRPLDNNTFETWEQTVDRVIGHQKWLWERAQGYSLDFAQSSELDDLRNLMLERKVLTSGRTLWPIPLKPHPWLQNCDLITFFLFIFYLHFSVSRFLHPAALI